MCGLTLAAGRIFDRTIGADPMPNFVDMDPEQAYHLMIDRALSEELGFESPQAAIDQIVYFPADIPGTPGEADQPLRIIGVVENRPLTFIGLGATSNFYSFRLDPRFQIARISADDVSGALEAIDAMWNRLAPTIPSNYRFVDEVFEENYRAFSRVSQIFAGLALLALFISTVGLFGMAIQVASRRTHEIGVRKTLGASTRQVIFMLLRDFAKPVLIANLIAWPLAYFVAKAYLSPFVHRVALTPLPFLLSLVLTVGVAWAAIGSQAFRAARVTPAQVLRYE